MAVFMINICKFNGCGITFPSLGDLIQHIEDTHIENHAFGVDYDPLVIEQKEASQPSCLPLSYVLKFFTEATRREYQLHNERKKLLAVAPPKPQSVRSDTPTGSEFDDEELMSHSEDSNDSWTVVEEYSSDFILRNGSRLKASLTSKNDCTDKPFACPVPGCKKRYKNINGIKYHSKNGHKKDGKVKKPYKCHCGKSYTTAQGLKAHAIANHIANTTVQQLTNGQQASNTSQAPPKPLIVGRNMQNLIVSATSEPQIKPNASVVEGKLLRILEAAKPKSDTQYYSSSMPKHSFSELQIIPANSSNSVDINGNRNVFSSQFNARFLSLVKQEDRIPKMLVRTNKLHTGYMIESDNSVSVPSTNNTH